MKFVSAPTRDEMPMEMAGQPCSGGSAQVQTDVEAIRMQDTAVSLGHGSHLVQAAQKLRVV